MGDVAHRRRRGQAYGQAWNIINSPSARRMLFKAGKSAYENFHTTPPKTPNTGPSGSTGGWAGSRFPRYTKSTNPRKGKRRHTKSKKVLVSKKQVKKWNKASKDASIDLSNYKYTYMRAGRYSCAPNQSTFEIAFGFDLTTLKGYMGHVPFYDATSATPTAAVTKDPTAFTNFNQTLHLKVSSQMKWINNYGVPVSVSVYCFVPKDSVNDNPKTLFENGLGDDDGAPDKNNVFTYPSNSKQLSDQYETHSMKKVVLQPGEEVFLGFKKKFTWNPSATVSDTDEYQKKLGGHAYCVRLQGVFGHNSVTPFHTAFSQAAIDVNGSACVKLRYDSGLTGGANFNKYDTSQLTAPANDVVIGWPSDGSNVKFSNTA